jgi:gamma-glutamyl-gamma-aminobutyrate hydrolase PuuD
MTQILIAPHFAKFPQSHRAMIKTSFSDYLLSRDIFPIMPVCSLKKDLYSNFLRLAESYLQSSDGLILQGGENLKLTKKPDLDQVVSPRDGFEMALVEVAARDKKPILGICRGLQLINVFFGGNLCEVSALSDFSHDKKSTRPIKIVDKMDLNYSHGLIIQ